MAFGLISFLPSVFVASPRLFVCLFYLYLHAMEIIEHKLCLDCFVSPRPVGDTAN